MRLWTYKTAGGNITSTDETHKSFRKFLEELVANVAGSTDEIVYVLPIDDVVEHTESEDCICGSESFPVPRGESIGWICVHRSLDGREFELQ